MNEWLDRKDFESHLKREHNSRDYGGDLGTVLDDCRAGMKIPATAIVNATWT